MSRAQSLVQLKPASASGQQSDTKKQRVWIVWLLGLAFFDLNDRKLMELTAIGRFQLWFYLSFNLPVYFVATRFEQG
jgi:hypothetical protein